MRSIFLIIPLLFGVCNSVRLTAVYKTTIISKPVVKFNDFPTKTKNDSLLAEFSKDFMKEFQKEVTIQSTDSVEVFQDSSIIYTIPTEMSGGQRVRFNSTKSVLKGNKFYNAEEGRKVYWEESEYKLFTATSEKATILNYETRVYVSQDKKIKIWVCKDLPALLNPGVQIVKPQGGILKYEIKDSSQQITSTIHALYKK